ncbi:MAG: hypothetical protein H6585_11770 [Flavobacteriales bacterium]|nr:hypothetical protein [Flavobacteriales bacterium]MCB9449007.1 hypothetical protein [Flavobacteriales bacterium]
MSALSILTCRPGDPAFYRFLQVPGNVYPDLKERMPLLHAPDLKNVHVAWVAMQGGQPVGRLAFYLNPALKYQDGPAACIGSYECVDNPEVALMLLNDASQLAKDAGCKWLIGPMDRSTWNGYRFSTDHSHPNFTMEPYHHLYYNDQFLANGFEVIGEYVSNLSEDLTVNLEAHEQARAQYLQAGARIRHMDMSRLTEELGRVADLCLEAFSGNFLYTPITREAFVQKYLAVKNLIDPEWVWLVEDEQGMLQALYFAVKDHLDPLNQTIIVKTVARRKGSPFKGIIRFLTSELKLQMQMTGHSRMVHAFMYSDNTSADISGDFAGKPYKRYALYARSLKG